MRIAVISDTHDALPPSFTQSLAGADEIWHLGDVSCPSILAELQSVGVPLFTVRGNCDDEDIGPVCRILEREGLTCMLIHIAPQTVPVGVDIVLHGHTHVPRNQLDGNGVRWINPGSPCWPRGGSLAGFAWMELKKGSLSRYERVDFDGSETQG